MGFGSIVGGIVGAAGSLISGSKASKGAEKGAEASLEATRLGVEEQQRQFDLINAQNAPARKIGYNAFYGLSDLVGFPAQFGSPDQYTYFPPSQTGQNGVPYIGAPGDTRQLPPPSYVDPDRAGAPINPNAPVNQPQTPLETEEEIRKRLLDSGEFNTKGGGNYGIYQKEGNVYIPESLKGTGGRDDYDLLPAGTYSAVTGGDSDIIYYSDKKELDEEAYEAAVQKALSAQSTQRPSANQIAAASGAPTSFQPSINQVAAGIPAAQPTVQPAQQPVQQLPQPTQQPAVNQTPTEISSQLPVDQGAAIPATKPGQYAIQDTPAYQFRYNEGLRALNRAYASMGKRISGERLRGIQEYGQQSATQEFEPQFARLAQLAGFGQGSTSVVAGAAQNTGNQIASLYGNLGNVQANAAASAGQYNAAGIVGAARGIGNIFNSSGGTPPFNPSSSYYDAGGYGVNYPG